MELLLTPSWGLNPFYAIVVFLGVVIGLIGFKFFHWVTTAIVLAIPFAMVLIMIPFAQQTPHQRSLLYNQIEVRGVQAQIKDQLEKQYDAKIVTLGSTKEHNGVREGYEALVKGDRVEVRWVRGGTEELCDVIPQSKYKPAGDKATLKVDLFCSNVLVETKGIK